MKELKNFKEEIHKCSKCGLCQAECPIYKITGNDCSVSRGHFIMLKGVLNNDLKMSKTINRYLDLCLKCGKCTKFCPSGIDVVDIILSAKNEYFKSHKIERIKTWFLKTFIFGLIPNFFKVFQRNIKSKTFDKKVLFFGGCGVKFKGNTSVTRILNNLNIEVITPDFNCCGIPYLTRGDLKEFNNSIKNYIKILKKYQIKDIITTCASCEKSLKDYIKWCEDSDKGFLKEINIKNIYEYLHENNLKIKLRKKQRVTYHKPCNIDNFQDIKWILQNTENLEYVEMKDFDSCCGLNGLSKIKEFSIMKNIFNSKRKNIVNSKTKIVLTSCLGCEIGLKSYSLNKYKVYDLISFLSKNM